MITELMDQLGQEWFKTRCGIPTASNFGKILSPTGKPSTQAVKYAYQLAGERITGIKEEGYSNANMQAGMDREEEGRNFFEFSQGVTLTQVGICYPNERKEYSCSPDSLILDAEEGFEQKNPIITTQVEYLLAGKLPTIYIPQVQGSMLITGYKAWWFLSYYPSLKPLIIRVERDEKYIELLKTAIYKFNKELDDIVKKIR